MLLCMKISAATYYVSPLGSNGNTGTSEEEPFQVVQFAINKMIAGDTLIVLDGFYSGTMGLKSGMTILAKNPGSVTFSGAEPVTSTFEKHNDKIYKTKVDKEIKQVFFNDRPMTWAQWPNIDWSENWQDDKKWRVAGSASTEGIFVCDKFNELSGKDLVGAYCFLRYGKGNSCYSRLIQSFDGTSLYWDTNNFFTTLFAGEDGSKGGAPDSKFFIAGSLDLLDAPGEWFVKDSVLYVYPPIGRDINKEVVLVHTCDYAIYETEPISDITIEGIDFLSTSVMFESVNNSNIKIINSNFNYVGAELLWINNLVAEQRPVHIAGSHIDVEHCLFAGAQNTALEIVGANLTVENCVFMENNRNANFQSVALKLDPSGTYKVNRNTFFNNCADAIRVGPMDDNIVLTTPPEMAYNNICNAGLYNTDVSGIYAPILGQKFAEVHHNWIHNVEGNGYRLDMAGYELSLHHNVFWESKRGMSVEGYRDFNIYNNTSISHAGLDQITRNQAIRQGYEDAPQDVSYPPIEDWNVLNNLYDNLTDGYPPSEKTAISASKAAGTLNPERSASRSFDVYNRGKIQGNIFGVNHAIFTNGAMDGLNLVPISSSVAGGVASHDSLIVQHVTSLDSFRGAYNVNSVQWYPGSDWMPNELSIVSTMAEAEAFAKAYKYVSVVPELNISNSPIGYLNRDSGSSHLASITWPDYKNSGDFDEWTNLRQDTLPEFSPDIHEYKLTLPANFKGIPALSASTQSEVAQLKIKRATSFRGTLAERTTTFTVTNTTNGDSTVYSVLFELGSTEISNSKPFISEIIKGRWNRDNYIELYNPINNSDSLNMGKYLVVNVPVATNEKEVLNVFKGIAVNSSDINYCYVPGYKYAFDKSAGNSIDSWSWKNGIEGAITPDNAVSANVAPGGVFVIGAFGNGNPKPNEKLIGGISTTNYVEVNLSLNSAFPNVSQDNNVTAYNLTRALFVYEIKNDSILAGTKGLWDDLDDYELVDRLQWDADSMGDVISGYPLGTGGIGLIRKPDVQVGNLLANSSFSAYADSCEWIHQNRGTETPADWYIERAQMGLTLGWHNMNVSNKGFISTVSSLVYWVDPGNAGDLKIAGDVSNTSVDAFMANLIKGEPLQKISVYDKGAVLTGDDLVSIDDTVVVVSPNGRYTTRYVIKSGVFSSNTSLEVVPGSGLILRNDSVFGFDNSVSVAEVFAGIACDPLSSINIIDANNNLVPLFTRSSDTSVSNYVVTKVYNGLRFEVVAEDGSVGTYVLVPNSTASDVNLMSNVFTIDQQEKTITGVVNGSSLSSFRSNIYASGNASLDIKNEDNSIKTHGFMQLGDYVIVTSADKTNSLIYTINLHGEKNDSVSRISIKKSVLFFSSPVKTAKVGSNYKYTVLTSGNGKLEADISANVKWLTFRDGLLIGTPTESDMGTDVKVSLTFKGDEDVVMQQFAISVIPNLPIAITSTPNKYALIGQMFSYPITTTGTGTLSFDPNVTDDYVGWLKLNGNTLEGIPDTSYVGDNTILINFANEIEGVNQSFVITVVESIPVGVPSGLAIPSALNVFPNPVNDHLIIELLDSQNASYTIVSYLGQTVTSGVLLSGSASVDLGGLTSGVYVVWVTTRSKTYSKKIIKN